MRWMLPILTWVTALPLAAWVLPTQNEWAAVQGEEALLTIAECGIPLPPTQAEARADVRYGCRQAGLKRALVYLTSRAKAERNRVSPEIRKTTAALARSCGAPELFSQYLELQAAGTLSRRQLYALEQALDYLVREVYGIDKLQLRVLSENLNLAPAEHMLYMLHIPTAGMYDLVPDEPPAQGMLLSDIQTMTHVALRADNILRQVRDRSGADAASLALLELLPLWGTTQPSQHHKEAFMGKLTVAEQLAVKMYETVKARLIQTRQELSRKNWYDSPCLEVIDELLR